MMDFPDELIADILLRLSVKPLLRFRCVCKTWCALIDKTTFVKQHLNNSATETNKSKHKLIIKRFSNLYSIGLYSLTDRPLKLVPPIQSSILGSCNGLLCLTYGSKANLGMLWNPATRKHIRLPVVKPHRSVGDFEYGFGYDSVSDDYKVILVHQCITDESLELLSETNVYSLRSNSWKMIEYSPHYRICGPAALACGVLHWIARDNFDSTYRNLVVSFDLATEEYMMITLSFVPLDDFFSMFVLELGGCLSVVCNNYTDRVFNVWVMKDYGVSESWTKLFTLSKVEILRTIEKVIPLAYSESGDEVLLWVSSEKLMWYNLEMRTTKVVKISGIFQFYRPVICLESLVSLGEKAENDEKQGEENEEAEEELLCCLYDFLVNF